MKTAKVVTPNINIIATEFIKICIKFAKSLPVLSMNINKAGTITNNGIMQKSQHNEIKEGTKKFWYLILLFLI